MEYKDIVNDVLSDERKKDFIVASLHESMSNLGFSNTLRDEFLENIDRLNITDFIGKHKDELDRKSTRLNSSHAELSRMPSSA